MSRGNYGAEHDDLERLGEHQYWTGVAFEASRDFNRRRRPLGSKNARDDSFFYLRKYLLGPPFDATQRINSEIQTRSVSK